jgi:peptide/nickel transport system ATP-binding protein
MVMYQGKIVEQGAVFDVFAKPQHPYTKGLLACRPRLDMKLKVLPVVTDFMADDSTGSLPGSEQKYDSVGDAILMNFIDEEEVRERQQTLMQASPLLQVKNLKTWFPVKKNFFGKAVEYQKAVDGVTFDVYSGETVGLVGESGCGKTTLGRTILRLIEPTAGQIIYDGRDLRTYSAKEMRFLRKDVQMIFQDPYSSLNPRLTVGEAMLEPMRIHEVGSSDAERKRHIMDLLRTVNLKSEHFYRYPHEFSGGQRQRICIARALALNPKFIICDESVSALDVSVQAQVLNLLNQLKQEFGYTCLFISHDLSVVKFMADRIIVMNKGIIEEMGFAEDIYEDPQKEYTRQLIKAIPKADLAEIRKRHLKRTLKQPAMMEFGNTRIFI